jgi:hypothetical protein
VESKRSADVFYGVVISGLHCALVKVDKQNRSFVHTRALQLLPTRFAETSSTPGITALTRLGFVRNDNFLYHLYSQVGKPGSDPDTCTPYFHDTGRLDKLPSELLGIIGMQLQSYSARVAFASVSPRTLEASISQGVFHEIFINDSLRLIDISQEHPEELHNAYFDVPSFPIGKKTIRLGAVNLSSKVRTDRYVEGDDTCELVDSYNRRRLTAGNDQPTTIFVRACRDVGTMPVNYNFLPEM